MSSCCCERHSHCCGHSGHHHCGCYSHHHPCECRSEGHHGSCHSFRHEHPPEEGRPAVPSRAEYVQRLEEERNLLERRLRFLGQELEELRKDSDSHV